MAYLFVRHKVVDFDRWLRVFEAHGTAREESGITDLQLLRDHTDPDVVVVFFRVEDLEKARAFTEKPEAYEAKEASGVIGDPQVLWLEEI